MCLLGNQPKSVQNTPKIRFCKCFLGFTYSRFFFGLFSISFSLELAGVSEVVWVQLRLFSIALRLFSISFFAELASVSELVFMDFRLFSISSPGKASGSFEVVHVTMKAIFYFWSPPAGRLIWGSVCVILTICYLRACAANCRSHVSSDCCSLMWSLDGQERTCVLKPSSRVGSSIICRKIVQFSLRQLEAVTSNAWLHSLPRYPRSLTKDMLTSKWGVPKRDTSLPRVMGCGSGHVGELLGRGRRRPHLETQVDVLARKL